jgi:hypothetical protein
LNWQVYIINKIRLLHAHDLVTLDNIIIIFNLKNIEYSGFKKLF